MRTIVGCLLILAASLAVAQTPQGFAIATVSQKSSALVYAPASV
jgi:hypothetical protein